MSTPGRIWADATVTGIGSLPGTDPVEAAKLVVGELPELPHLAELPGRGPGADLLGRSAALLVDLAVEIAPSGWAVTAHAGRDLRHARDLLARDLDAFEAAWADRGGPVKVQVAGPWTLAAGLELPSGHRMVSDPGAVRDLTASLAEGLSVHVAEVRRRLGGVDVIVQLDEPSLPAVIGGRVPTPSGYGTVRAVDVAVAERRLAEVLAVAAAGARVVHCCAADVPIALLRSAGANAVSLDAALVAGRQLDALGEAVDAGTALWLGVVSGVDAAITPDGARGAFRRIWNTLGFAPEAAPGSVVLTPACGLAGASPGYVRRAFAVLREVSAELVAG